MEQLILEIETYTLAHGITPQKFLRLVIDAQWGQWQKWKDGTSSPTMRIVDKMRDYMAAHPVSDPDASLSQGDPQPAALAAQPQEQNHDTSSAGR